MKTAITPIVQRAAAKTRFFIYARKSTDDPNRQQRSITDQLAEVQALAHREELTIAHEFTEKQSAKVTGRPIFNEMLERIERGEASGIIAWHPDRLARNALDAGRIIHLVDTGKITDLRFPTFRFEATAQGKFMLMVMFGQSKYYIDNLSENIRRGWSQKLKNGGWPQHAPVGYENDVATRSIVPHPINGPIITRMFELYATGQYTFVEIRDMILRLGLTVGWRGRSIGVSKVQYALKNPFYYGVMRFGGGFYDGKHEPLVSQELFDNCQRVMKRRGRAPAYSKLKPFPYRRLLRCGACGCTITTEVQKGHHYLHCTRKTHKCVQPFVREDAVTKQFQEKLRWASIRPEVAERLLAKLQMMKQQDALAREAEKVALAAAVGVSDERINRLTKAYLDGAFTLEEYRDSKNALIDERVAAKKRLEEFLTGASSFLEPLRRFINDAVEAGCVADRAKPSEIAMFVRNIFSNPILRDRRLQWEMRGVWQVVETEAFAQLKSRESKGETGNGERIKQDEEGEW